MLTNNIEFDIKVKILEEGIKQTDIADKMGISRQQVNHILKKDKNVLNSSFVNLMEALGYDIQLNYVKRND